VPELEHLALAHGRFGDVLSGVSPAQWSDATPCEGWSVGDLLDHVVGGEHVTLSLLDGATPAEATAEPFVVDAGQVQAQFGAVASATEEAFAAPGALERTIHHFIGDVTGRQVLGFRIADITLHGWDLARALDVDTTLDPVLVEAVWTDLQPIAPFIGTTGLFGSGPSGDVDEGAPLEVRLLDLTGRRPS
jgi:uncharacterized protein (TIGR03086 family)